MAPVTLSKISTVTVGAGGVSSIDFTNIPQIYTDLIVMCSIRTTRASVVDGISVTFNNTYTGSSNREVYGSGSGTGSGADPTGSYVGYVNGNNATANVFGNSTLYIPNYTSSNAKSSFGDSVSENNTTAAYQSLEANIWSNGSAINRLTLSSYTGSTIMQYSTATLYGVKASSIGAKATGGNISQIGNYYIHTFTGSGTFTPLQNMTVDYLVVGGGGGGGARYGGGGGAGGLRCTVGATGGGGSIESPLSLTANTGYTVTVGAGGSGGTDGVSNGSGSNGQNSVFSTITSIGGGGGAGNGDTNPQNTAGSGGSGGGGTYLNGARGTGTANQGYDGGAGSGSFFGGGGGGGAGGAGVGGDAGGANFTVGGIGIQTSISGASTFYAAGGGGYGALGGSGIGGNGGGAAGGTSIGKIGNTSTGSGGGGGAVDSGGTGASGVVIIRYTI